MASSAGLRRVAEPLHPVLTILAVESMNFTVVRSSPDTDPATSFWPFEDIVDFIFLNKIARGENIINITYICVVLSSVLNDFIIL